MRKIEPNIFSSAIFFRLFAKPIKHGNMLAPSFLYPAADYWCPEAPKWVNGENKIVFMRPLECDAAVKMADGRTISLAEMMKSLCNIPFMQLEIIRDDFLFEWDRLVSYAPEVLRLQVGLNDEEFNHLYKAFGPGAWVNEIAIKHDGSVDNRSP